MYYVNAINILLLLLAELRVNQTLSCLIKMHCNTFNKLLNRNSILLSSRPITKGPTSQKKVKSFSSFFAEECISILRIELKMSRSLILFSRLGIIQTGSRHHHNRYRAHYSTSHHLRQNRCSNRRLLQSKTV